MCVEEEGDGKAIGGSVSSIIHQLMDQTGPPIYLTLQGAERDVFLLSSSPWLCFSLDANISIFFSSAPPTCSLLLSPEDG